MEELRLVEKLLEGPPGITCASCTSTGTMKAAERVGSLTTLRLRWEPLL